MKHIVSPMTLIDFLGIFIPGAVLILVLNLYIGNIANICTLFFGDNELVLCIFFAVISYICGCMLHQIGWLIEDYLWEVNAKHEEHFDNSAVKVAYKAHFAEEAPNDTKKCIEAGKRIYAYIQKNGRPSRILIFHASYTMSRTLVVTALVIIMVEVSAILCSYEKYIKMWPLIILCGCIIAVFRSRWVRFEKKCVDESYMLFITENHDASSPQSGDCRHDTDL